MATANELRAEAVRLMLSRKKCNRYTQGPNRFYFFGKPRDGDPGYSDCSQAVQKSIFRATGINIGGNTDAQIRNQARGQIVEMAGPAQVQPTLSLLKPGDAIYFAGNAAHIMKVGHVEMVIDATHCAGHGSGIGPTVKTIRAYCAGRTGSRKYLCTIRWILDDETTPTLGDRLLKYGMTGDDVAELQRLLKALGHDLGIDGVNKDGIDGDYGPLTRDAVKAFEATADLTADGIADIDTITAIKSKAGASLGRIRVTAAKVANIRSGPGTDNQVIGYARHDDVLDLDGQDSETWYGVSYKGAAAFIAKSMAEKIK